MTGSTLAAFGAGVFVRAPEVDVVHVHSGSIVVNNYWHIPACATVLAVGDNASIQDGRPVPLVAASAMQEGNALGKNLVRLLRGKPLIPVRYRNLGNVVALGHGAGVAEIGGRVIAGIADWLLWCIVHVARLTNLRNKVATALNRSAAWFYDADTVRFETGKRQKTAARGR